MRRTKITVLFSFITFMFITSSIILLVSGPIQVVAQTEGDRTIDFTKLDPDAYITTGHLISNFRLVQFNGMGINDAGFTSDGNFHVTTGRDWVIDKDDINLIHNAQYGNYTFFHYEVKASNWMNLKTTFTLQDVIDPRVGSLMPVTSERTAGSSARIYWQGTPYNEGGWIGLHYREPTTKYDWEAKFQISHYQFGDPGTIVSRKMAQNASLLMDFDVNPNLFRESFTTHFGIFNNLYTDVEVRSSSITYTETERMSTDIPRVHLENYKEEGKTNVGEAKPGNMQVGDADFSYRWNADPKLHLTPVSEVSQGVMPTEAGASLNARMITDETCRLTLPVPRLSPVVSHQQGYVSWYNQYFELQDGSLTQRPRVRIAPGQGEKTNLFDAMVGVNNRYIQHKVEIVFDVFTEYEVNWKESVHANNTLGRPKEEWDDMVFIIHVHGTDSGDVTVADPSVWGFLDSIMAGYGNFIFLIIIGIIVLAILGIIMKLSTPLLIGRTAKRRVSQYDQYRHQQYHPPPPPDYDYYRDYYHSKERKRDKRRIFD